MKLLLDENISHRLIAALDGAFPGSQHVRQVGLARADDFAIWTYAKEFGFAIVTLDSDFYDLSLLHGFPPKVVWLRTFNSTTPAISAALKDRISALAAFLADPDNACYIISV